MDPFELQTLLSFLIQSRGDECRTVFAEVVELGCAAHGPLLSNLCFAPISIVCSGLSVDFGQICLQLNYFWPFSTDGTSSTGLY